MVYLKSLVAGTVGVAIAAALSPIVMGSYFFVYRSGTSETIGWDPTSLAKQPLIWTMAALVFVAGFAWEFRRAYPK